MIRIKQTGWVPSMVVAVVGFGIVVSCLIFQVLRGINGLAIMGTVVGGVFALSNYGAFRKREVAAFFKDKGMFSLGGKIQRRILSNIHALQIIDTLLRGSGVTHIYELNIVFTDASRLNILRCSDSDEAWYVAVTLADFLNVSVLQAAY